MSSEIERIDLYGDAGHCGHHDYEHICFCKDQVFLATILAIFSIFKRLYRVFQVFLPILLF